MSGNGCNGFRVRILPEPKRRIRILTREETDKLLEALSEHLRPSVRFALAIGCSMSEILSLEMAACRY